MNKILFYIIFFFSIIGINYAYDIYTDQSIELKTGVVGDYSKFGVSLKSPVVIYTAKWCGACKMLKAYLNSNNIEYLNFDIEDDLKAKEILKSNEMVNLPVIFIDNMVFEGFNEPVLSTKLNKYINL